MISDAGGQVPEGGVELVGVDVYELERAESLTRRAGRERSPRAQSALARLVSAGPGSRRAASGGTRAGDLRRLMLRAASRRSFHLAIPVRLPRCLR